MPTRIINIRKRFEVEGVATDVTTAKLSDPTGTFGIKRNDTDAVVVAAGTDMTKTATGVYEYSFEDAVGVAHTAYIELVYLGATYHFEADIPARSAVGPMLASYSSLLERVGHFLFGIRTGFSADQTDDIEDCIRDGLHDVYTAHSWSFFRPVKEITTEDGEAEYDLPAACEAIEGDLYYEPGRSDFYEPVKQRHDSEIKRRQQQNDETGRPMFFSVRTVEFDPTTGSTRKLVMYPRPDDEYVLRGRMSLRPMSIDSVNQHPIGGEILTQIILEACLAAAERNFDEGNGVHTKRFEELMPLAIQADKEATSPTTLGPDAGDGKASIDRSAFLVRMGDVIFNDQIM